MHVLFDFFCCQGKSNIEITKWSTNWLAHYVAAVRSLKIIIFVYFLSISLSNVMGTK